jgi:DNA polymerase-1
VIANSDGMMPTDAQSAAAYYLERGFPPIPVPRSGRCKAPILDGWQNLRPTQKTLGQLFPTGQALNVGLLLGKPSQGLVDIDLDCPEAVAAGAMLLPATGWVSGHSSKPKSHYWYLVDDPPEKAADEHHDVDGEQTMLLEVRSTGGQTVVPPGVHESGETLVWYRFTHPAQIDFRELALAARMTAAVALLARHWPGQTCRQTAFLALAGGLLRAGWPQERAEQFIRTLAVVTGDEEERKRVQTVAQTAGKLEQDRKATGFTKLEELLGSSAKEILRRVRQWLGMAPARIPAQAPKKTVRLLEPYRAFPTDALPEPLRRYVLEGAQALGCDPCYLALPALAAVAGTIGNARSIQLKRGWEEPCVIWSVIVGDSGSLKSPACHKSVRHLFKVQKRLLAEYREAMRQYEEELAEYEAVKRAAKNKGEELPAKPERPVLKRVICSDTTIEKLAEILEDNPHGIFGFRDELSGWLGSFQRYKGKQGGTDLPAWLEMHRAGTVVVDRKTGERRLLFIPRAAVSITGGIQPGVLARLLTTDFLDCGLGARLLMAMPPRLPKRWSELEVSPDIEQAYENLFDRLAALDFDTDEDGHHAPFVLGMSADAKAAWVDFYNAWAREQAAVEGEMAAAYSKLEGYAARLALLHHVVTCVGLEVDDRREIGPVSIQAGIRLCRWFAQEARRIYTTLSESEEERETRRLVEFVQSRGGQITARELQKSNSRKYRTAGVAEVALEGLVEAGRATWQERPPSERGGRPTRVLVLNTTFDTTDTTDTTSGESDDDDGDLPPRSSDTTPDTTPPNPGISQEIRGCVGNVGRRIQESEHANGGGTDTCRDPGCVGQEQVPSNGCVGRGTETSTNKVEPTYVLVRTPEYLQTVRTALDESDVVALDIETTGLNPRKDRVRLLSLAVPTIDGGTCSYLIDCFAVGPQPVWDVLRSKDLVIHNALFDLQFLSAMGFTPSGTVHDTMLMAQLLGAGSHDRVSLAACCERWQGQKVDKSLQQSDWSGQLSEDQLAYAATDVEVLAALYERLRAEIKRADLEQAAEIEQRCLPSMVWMSQHGVGLDRDTWQGLAQDAKEQADRLEAELTAQAPCRPNSLFGESWNWNSPQQVQEALKLAGCELEKTDDDALAACEHPLANLLRRYRLARKRCTAFGNDWLSHVHADGRVYPGWRQIGAASGRMSCSDPNLQQLPRGDHRRCIVAPPGRVLIKADYSQIELRIAAKVSGDKALLEAYRQGEDLHARTARSVLGIQEVTKQDRQLAKALNFGLVYGMGHRGFRKYAKSQYGLDLSEDDARRYRNAFFKSYPGLAAWHRQVRTRRAKETRTQAKRRRLLNSRTPDTQRLNTPVQGTGADGLKSALGLLWERRDQAPGAFPVLAVHDEIVIEADAAQADAGAAWLKKAMVEAMSPLVNPVPVEVDIVIAPTWGR